MSDPKKRHSEPKNSHINSFRWSIPVVVCSSAAGACCNVRTPYSVAGSNAQP